MSRDTLSETQKKAAVMIGRQYWSTEYKKQHPSATKEQSLEHWKSNRREFIKLGRAAVRQMAKKGLNVTKGA